MFKKVLLEQLAIRNVRTVSQKAEVAVGDIVTVIDPWKYGDNYKGIVVEISDQSMTIYHGNLNKKLVWPLNVKCKVIKL